MTINWTTQNQFLDSSWFFITVPKANLDYESGGSNTGEAISLITSSNVGSATVTVGGSSFTVNSDDAVVTVGSGYNPDIWYFDFSSQPAMDDAIGKAVVITVEIDNPMLVTTLLADWAFEIKTERGVASSSGVEGTDFPTDYARYDYAIAAPISTGLTVSTILTTTSGTTAAISAGGDGLGAEDITYQFTVANTNAVPADGVMILTVPDGVTVPSNSVSDFVMVCTSGCDTAGTLSYDSGDRQITIEDSFGSYVDAGSSISFSLFGWTNPTDTDT